MPIEIAETYTQTAQHIKLSSYDNSEISFYAEDKLYFFPVWIVTQNLCKPYESYNLIYGKEYITPDVDDLMPEHIVSLILDNRDLWEEV